MLETTRGNEVGAEALDRNPATAWTSGQGLARGAGLVVRVTNPRPLSALVLLVDLEASPLAVPWVASIQTADGEVVVEGPIRNGLQWVGGVPRAGRQALLVVLLGEQATEEVHLVFQGPGPPLSIAEAFVYGPRERQRDDPGAAAAREALLAARAGRWDESASLYRRAWQASPGRASYHAAWARAVWRSKGRRWLDVEGLDDGGPDFVKRR